jgi:hypothetical protein
MLETCGLFFNAVAGREEVTNEVWDPGFLFSHFHETVPANTPESKGFLQKFFDIVSRIGSDAVVLGEAAAVEEVPGER